ncbi:hypothetical protein COLO4_36133 [Corchorus olitorius]|uniref:Uncharacterized protein n=1 Tax=Corchorus olitorius TaxID=93759 RepID=A0A1R3GAW7_9ROSI|nr:hypothetical protein COLO4_36133 [Corchorus olitorius]
MGFFSSICCCFYSPSRVSGHGEVASAAAIQPLRPNSIQTDSSPRAILVPNFPVTPNLSRL